MVQAETDQRYLVPQHAKLLEDVGVLNTKAAAITSVDSYKRWVWGVLLVAVANGALSVAALLHHHP
jgi:hypothetical protein